jgi:hypothetical protein
MEKKYFTVHGSHGILHLKRRGKESSKELLLDE